MESLRREMYSGACSIVMGEDEEQEKMNGSGC